jgi:putative transposase
MLFIQLPLSQRNVEDLRRKCGIEIRHQTVRFWWNRLGPLFAAEIRRKRADRMRGREHWR